MAAAGTTGLFQQLTVLLTLATLSHFFFKRFRQPTIVGEIAIGILLGPSVLGYLQIFQFDENFIDTFSILGAIFLLFLIGLESDFRVLYTRKNFLVAAGGVVLPLVFGFLAAYFLVPPTAIGASSNQFLMAIFVGAALTATSTAIAASILLELGLLQGSVGQTIMGAAVVDDILSLVILSVVVGMSRGGLDLIGIAFIIVAAVAFIGIGIAVGLYFFGPIVVRLQVSGMRLGLKHGGFIIAMAIAFFYSLVAESIGLSAIIGAFLAGTMFASVPLKEDFAQGARYFEAIFTPIFFIALELQVNVGALVANIQSDPTLLVFAAVLTVIALVTKVVGCAIPARAQGLSRNEANAVGWGMAPRGEVGLIVAVTAVAAQVISDALFTIIVLVMILVTILPASMFKRALQKVQEERRRAKEPESADAA